MHHHGSRYSSNANWLNVTRPKIGVISVGAGNSYGHPTADALTRLHAVGTKTYWTTAGRWRRARVGPRTSSRARWSSRSCRRRDVHRSVRRRERDLSDVGVRCRHRPPAGPPIGVIDTPADMTSVAGEVAFTGWAIDNSGIAGVDIYRSPVVGRSRPAERVVFVGTATQIEGARRRCRRSLPAVSRCVARGLGLHGPEQLPAQRRQRHLHAARRRALDERRERRDRIEDDRGRERDEPVPVRHHRHTRAGRDGVRYRHSTSGGRSRRTRR